MDIKTYQESAAYITEKSNDFCPEILLILGSGLGFLGDQVIEKTVISYQEIPHCPVSTAPGHNGALILGKLQGKNVAVMQGRVHFYEGYTLEEVAFLVRVVHLLGAEKMIVTNACGAVNELYNVGDLLLLSDFIKFTDTSPLTGKNVDALGSRFPDMSHVFSPGLRNTAKSIAAEMSLSLQEGVYFYFTGPQYETPAEIRAVRMLGADAVGMSTVPECIAARHAGMEILGVSLVTNMAAGVLNQTLSEAEVLKSAAQAKPYFSAFILRCLDKM
ncbi:MAG: purine-nucleoside phosphorylase [Christensenellaceae bacterium]